MPEGKHLFGEMTVFDNLMMGAYRKEAQAKAEETLELVYSLFPILEERAGSWPARSPAASSRW